MIRNILEETKKLLVGDLSLEERAVTERLMFSQLDALREYRTMTALRVEYQLWFSEYQRMNAKKECVRELLKKVDEGEYPLWT